MAHWAKPGVKCVCVERDMNTDCEHGYEASPNPSYREICIVERVNASGAAVYLWIVGYDECEFLADLFRPLNERTQEDDVALFAPILTTREREST